MSINTQVVSIIAAACHMQASEVTEDLELVDAGADSLIQASVITQIELALGVQFSANQRVELMRMSVVKDLVESVSRMLGIAT